MQPNRPVYIVPQPAQASFGEESICLADGWRLACEAPGAAGLVEAYAAVLGIPAGAGGRRIRLAAEEMPADAYRIEVSAAEGVVAAGGQAGFLCALQTLRQMLRAGRLPACRIEDRPRLGIRGFHTNLNQQFDRPSVERLLDLAGRMKLNAVVLEYEARFPYDRHARISASNAFSPEDVAGMLAVAGRSGLEAIPLLQSLGHLDYVLCHEEYAHVREEEKVRHQMCPLNPQSFDLFVEMAEEVLAAHPGIRFLHVGGDETRQLGVCPRCAERAGEAGLGGVYGPHMEKVLRWVIDRGLRPIIWDDMLCAHPEALPFIPRETVIMYWEYWSVRDPSPYFVARFDRRGRPAIVHDERWGKEWPLESLPDVQRAVLERFSAPVRLEENLGPAFLERYGGYLGPEFPKFLRAFPYLEYFQDQGFEVLAGPTALGNHELPYGLPNFERFFHNIHAYAGRCRENAKTLGLVTTSWYNYPPELLHHGLVATGQFAWSEA